MTKWHGGKGSASRKNEDHKKYEENWEKIFNNKEKKMPIKLKPTAKTFNKATRKTQIEHHFIKTTDTKILEDMLAADTTRPKIKQKIRNELTRRNK
jgi:hypothetical protein|tara:strand:+ start:95 stop:382 length:288 start_codon:yes stop_codon:yes gene_type:complete